MSGDGRGDHGRAADRLFVLFLAGRRTARGICRATDAEQDQAAWEADDVAIAEFSAFVFELSGLPGAPVRGDR